MHIDFNPSSGAEIKKRGPAIVVSSHGYSLSTGFVAVCPITSAERQLFIFEQESNEKCVNLIKEWRRENEKKLWC